MSALCQKLTRALQRSDGEGQPQFGISWLAAQRTSSPPDYRETGQTLASIAFSISIITFPIAPAFAR